MNIRATSTQFFLLLLSVFAIPINLYPLRNWDEAWYGEIIKNMASGNYNLLVPFWNGEYYFDKPPLYFWLSLPIVKMFGMGEWQVRFVSVIAAAVCTYLVFLIGKKLFDTKTGIIATIIFITLGQVYVRLSHGNLDALLIALFLGAFYCYLISHESKRASFLAGVLIGLGFFTKGWALGLFPVFVIFLYNQIIEKRFLPRSCLHIFTGIFVSCGWWYILGIIVWQEKFINWYLLTMAEGVFRNPLADFDLSYFKYLLRDLGVWIVPFFVPFIFNYRKVSRELMFFGLLILVFIIAISFSREKLDWHILPIYPFVALLSAWGVNKFTTKYCPRCLVPFLIILLLAQIYIAERIENIYPDRSNVGANLGRYTKKILDPKDTVILDEHDFTSFLYYSDAGKVFVVSEEGGKPGEFWTIKYSDLHKTMQDKQILLITPNESVYLQFLGRSKLVGEYEGYKFIRVL